MVSLETTYLGIPIKNPIIIGSCGLTGNIASIKRIASFEPGAIVLKSLFEEQIIAEVYSHLEKNTENFPEADSYISSYVTDKSIEDYLTLIKQAKEETSIPIIASIHCKSSNEWVSFAKRIELAGADALEINASILPFSHNTTTVEIEEMFFNILEELRKNVSIPIAFKMNYYSAALSHLITKLSWTNKIQGFVLFNRLYNPDINIFTQEIGVSNIFSSPIEYSHSLRWTALLSSKIKGDICAATGVHSGETIIKLLLAGASAVQIVSAIYQNGPEVIADYKKTMQEWMISQSYFNISDFKSKLAANQHNNLYYERSQFMKYYGSIE